MRIAPTISASLLAFAALSAAGEPASMEAPLVFGPPLGGSVTYRFGVDVERPVDANGAPASGADDGNSGDRLRPPHIPPIVVRFDGVDPGHVRLTLVDLTATDTILADRAPDGQLHAKLKRGSRWARPLAMYDRLARLTEGGDKLALGAKGPASLQPVVSEGTISGELARSRSGVVTTLAYSGEGTVTPGDDFSGGPNPGGGGFMRSVLGGMGGAMGAGGMGGGPGGGGGGGGGRGGNMGDGERGGEPGDSPSASSDGAADVTVSSSAQYPRGVFARATGTETIERRAGLPLGVTWTVEDAPEAGGSPG